MSSLDIAWGSATKFLDGLPDYRKPTMGMAFRRVDDFRRHIKGIELSNTEVWIMLKEKEEEHTATSPCQWRHFKAVGTDPAKAIEEVLEEVKQWLK